MSILNRYILRKFLVPFFGSFGALCVILLVSKIFDRLDRFLADNVGWKHVVGYLASSMPLQALQVLPVACLLATLFVVGNLARTKEYVAGLAGGLPPEKFLGGIFLAGFLISLAGLAANETFIPVATRYSTVVFREKIKHLGEWKKAPERNMIVSGAQGRLWMAGVFYEDLGKMDRVVVDMFNDGRLASQIDAESAQWSDGKWKFTNGVARNFDQNGMDIVSTENFVETTFPFSEQPSDLVVREPEAEEMNFKQLKRHIKRLESLGIPVRKLEVELMMKLSIPFACFVVTFLGVPLAMSGKGNRAMGIAAGGALTLVYLGFIQFGKALAQRIIPPWSGAWLGNVVFLTVALVLWWRMRRTA